MPRGTEPATDTGPSSQAESFIETAVLHGVGHIVLARPAALNSLDGSMIRDIRAALEEWRDDPDVSTVLVTSGSPKAFCAGGDIKVVWEAIKRGDEQFGADYFSAEYELNAVIAHYPKPYVSIIDGLALGGGLGISIHGSIRVVTEQSSFAMPETAIGFVPDVGSSYFLSRLPGQIGKYLALTGARISGSEAMLLGLGTHFVTRSKIDALTADIVNGGDLTKLLDKYSTAPPETTLSFDRTEIDAVFRSNSILDMVDLLPSDEQWSRHTKTLLLSLSPTSLTATNELFRAAKGNTLEECLTRELALASWIITQPDFAEGVRATLVDKDRNPQWSPLVIEMVDPELIRRQF